MTTPILASRLRCPACGHEELLDMPTDACLFFHPCSGCGELLRPRDGDCCVFCSYGSVKCPPVQLAGDGACCDPADAGETAAETAPRGVRWADSAGALGAIVAALCCMGAPIVVGVLGALGLGWFRRDAILWPLMFVSLGVALWGLLRDRESHGMAGPLESAAIGAAALVAGVVFVHGPPARALIYGGALALLVATGWNIVSRRGPAAERIAI